MLGHRGASCSVVVQIAHRLYSVARGFIFTQRVTKRCRAGHFLPTSDDATRILLYEPRLICWVPGMVYTRTFEYVMCTKSVQQINPTLGLIRPTEQLTPCTSDKGSESPSPIAIKSPLGYVQSGGLSQTTGAGESTAGCPTSLSALPNQPAPLPCSVHSSSSVHRAK